MGHTLDTNRSLKISSTSEANLILALVRSYLKKKEKVRSSPDEQSAFKSRSVFPVDEFYIIMKTNSSLIFLMSSLLFEELFGLVSDHLAKQNTRL